MKYKGRISCVVRRVIIIIAEYCVKFIIQSNHHEAIFFFGFIYNDQYGIICAGSMEARFW